MGNEDFKKEIKRVDKIIGILISAIIAIIILDIIILVVLTKTNPSLWQFLTQFN